MKSNFIDSILGFTCFGESHGKALGIVIEDIIPGIDFPFEKIQKALNERKPGNSKFASQRKEEDLLQVISGVYEGKTTGMPICLLVYNKDFNSADYEQIKEIFRPGHADFSWYHKFKILDWRGGGRASGRETISRVIASVFLDEFIAPLEILAYPIKIGKINANNIDETDMLSNDLKWPDASNYEELEQYLQSLKQAKNSVGAVLHCEIRNCPPGLGEPVFDKLEANLSRAILSIGGVKGIEFGLGFELASMHGSQANDSLVSGHFTSNHQGGILGGVSNGQNIIMNIALKPIASIGLKQLSCDIYNNDRELVITGRHDVCLIPRIIPVVIAMIKICLSDFIAHQKLIDKSSLSLIDYREAIDKIDEDILIALKSRMEISTKIGDYKKTNNLPIENLDREKELIKTLLEKSEIININSTLVKNIWTLIINESKKQQ